MSGEYAFSHTTAAELLELPLPLYAGGRSLHVSVRSPRVAPHGAGVVGHRLAAERWATREVIRRDYATGEMWAFPVLAPELVWAGLASALDHDDLIALGDALVGGETPLCTSASLRATADAWAGRRGARALTSAALYIRTGSLSRPESLLRVMLVRAGFPEPQLNVRVADRRGQSLYRADLSWPQFRVLIEYEGDGHRTSRGKFRSDIMRGEEYADGDWFSMRASADDVFADPSPFFARVARRLRARGWSSSSETARIVGARR